MKVLQVNNVYAEKSTGKITKVLHDGLLREGWESVVVYGRGKTFQEPGVIRLCPDWYGKANSLLSRITGMPYGGCLLATWRLQRIIRRENPDLVHLQCINGNFVNIYRLVNWLKKRQIKTMVGLHAEFMYTGNCGHAFDCLQWRQGCAKCLNVKKATKSWFFDRTKRSWEKMYRAFSNFQGDCLIVPVSPWTQDRAKASAILETFRFQTIYNGIDCPNTFAFQPEQVKKDRTVLNVTAHFSADRQHAKGGWYLVELAKRMPEITFWVAGKADACSALPDNLVLLGEIRDQKELASLYNRAKLSILVSQRETFSMPCAESLCCGTPVVGFKAGAPEQIALGEHSEFVDFGDISALEDVVRRWMDADGWDEQQIAWLAEEKYSAATMIRAYMDAYRRLLWS